MKEIVGAQIGTLITNNINIIKDAVDDNKITRFLSRQEMEFMSCMDLGVNWDKMASGPTLFLIDENGKPHSAKEAVDTSKG